jgi:hypothetical protein
MTEEITTTWAMLPATSKQVEESVALATQLQTVLEHMAVTTTEDEQNIANVVKEAHGRWKELDALRKSVTKPAVDAQRTINDHFKPALTAWDKAKKTGQRLLNDAAERREAANQARIEAAAAGSKVALAQIEETTPPAGMQHRREVDIEVVDFDVVPREYLAVDWSKLKIMAKKGEPPPPGVVFHYQTKVVPTGRS